MHPVELPPALLHHLVNVTVDEITDTRKVLALSDGADPTDPDAWGILELPESSGGIIVGTVPPEGAEVGTGFADYLGFGFVNPDGTRSAA